ncbi:MAG: signal peptide peptidase SppA [Porticoccaceae bacterium]
MSDTKPGILRRLFRFLGALVRIVRTLLSTALLLIFIAVLASLFGHDLKPLPEHALLRIAPTGTLVEQRTWSDPRELLGPGGPAPETRVADLVEAIGAAATDTRIAGIVLELDELAGGGIDKLETLGQALLAFRTSGKPVIAAGDSYTQQQYYLASFADEIHLNPFGNVLLTGIGSYHLYFKEALDKLRINFHVFRVGTYKDAVEPFIGTGMSDASREHTAAWLTELWREITTGIETRRHLAPGAIDDYVNAADIKLAATHGDGAQLALQSGLIDHVSTRPELLARLRGLAGNGDEERDYDYVNVREYLVHVNLHKPAAAEQPKIGVLVASGVIYDGDQQAGAIGGDSLARLIRQTREKAAIKALVLRIDSPGGSAFAADLIRQELLATRAAGMPVVVSMGTVAASGGYWIAAEADEIWAEPTTITGSIGVFGMLPTFEDSLAAIGIHNDGVGTNPLAGALRIDRPLSDQAARLIQGSVDNIYRRFVGLVSSGRGMDVAAVDSIAQGRVWTGRQAQERGLVDRLGGLDAAVAAAARRAGVENYQTVPIEPPLDLRERFLRQLMESGQLPEALIPAPAASLTARLGELLRLLDRGAASDWMSASRRGVFLHCLECASLQ